MGRMKKTFESRVNKTSTCWLWTGSRTGHGYGTLRRDGQYLQAHRYSWMQANGPIPEGLVVCHRCDVKLCVRPSHLFLGTKAENNHDRHAKGRDATGDSNGSRTRPETLPRGAFHWRRKAPELAATGERHGMAKLTEDDIRAIRARSHERRKDIAAEFGVTPALVSQIIYRRIWRNVV